jgi:hypothetical protein
MVWKVTNSCCLASFGPTVTLIMELSYLCVMKFFQITFRKEIVGTSQETNYVSATDTNRLMLYGETVVVHCENHTEHTDTPWAVHTSQETHYTSAIEPNRLMLFGKTVAVYCENRTEDTDALCGQSVPHRKQMTYPLQSPTG